MLLRAWRQIFLASIYYTCLGLAFAFTADLALQERPSRPTVFFIIGFGISLAGPTSPEGRFNRFLPYISLSRIRTTVKQLEVKALESAAEGARQIMRFQLLSTDYLSRSDALSRIFQFFLSKMPPSIRSLRDPLRQCEALSAIVGSRELSALVLAIAANPTMILPTWPAGVRDRRGFGDRRHLSSGHDPERRRGGRRKSDNAHEAM